VIVDKIHNHLKTKKKGDDLEYRKRKRRSNRKPSLTASIITACPRLNWYKFKGIMAPVPDDIDDAEEYSGDPLLLLKFWDGDRIHEDTADLMEESGVHVYAEEFGVTCHDVYARVDAGILLDCDDCDEKTQKKCPWYKEGETRVKHRVEVKSMNGNTARIFSDSGIRAFPSYYAQAQITVGAEPVTPTIFLVKDKDSSAYMEELVIPDPPYIEELVEAKRRFDEDFMNDYPPERPNNYTSDECKGCDFYYRCWFSHIIDVTVKESIIKQEEYEIIQKFYNLLVENRKAYDDYVLYHESLRSYIALLHNRYAGRRVKIAPFGINSVMVNFIKSTNVDKDALDRILSDEEKDEVFYDTEVTFFRTMIKGHPQ